MKNLVIVGDGGFAREVEWLVARINQVKPTWNLLGFIDKDENKPKVIGNDDYIVNSKNELYVSIAIGDPKIRRKLYNIYKSNSRIKFANLIDPSVLLSEQIKLGEGNIICAGTILTVDISIGCCNLINLDCTVGHDVMIHDFVTVNPSVNVSGNVVLASGSFIGTGTQIIQGITIGNNTVVGAGAVVNHDLPSDCTAVGVPARVIKEKK